MIPVRQKYIYIEGKQHGDCWRACLASILECDIDTFPAWELDQEWADYFYKVVCQLESMGYIWGEYKIENTTIDCLMEQGIDGYVIAVGKSPRSTPEKRINHAVVWRNGIAHDPHPFGGGIQDIISFEVIVKTI